MIGCRSGQLSLVLLLTTWSFLLMVSVLTPLKLIRFKVTLFTINFLQASGPVKADSPYSEGI